MRGFTELRGPWVRATGYAGYGSSAPRSVPMDCAFQTAGNCKLGGGATKGATRNAVSYLVTPLASFGRQISWMSSRSQNAVRYL